MSYAVIYKVRRGLLHGESSTNMVVLETRAEALDFSRGMGKLREWVKVVELTGIRRLDDMLVRRIKESLPTSDERPQDLAREALESRVAHLQSLLAQQAH